MSLTTVKIQEPSADAATEAAEDLCDTSSGRYVYCVVESVHPTSVKERGIEGRPVYSVSYRDVSAVVHRCFSKPYQSRDAELTRRWVVEHHQIVKACWVKTGTVVPMTFNTIVKNSDQEVKDWLRNDYQRLRGKMRELCRKAEYGVQIFWIHDVTCRRLIEASSGLRRLTIQRERCSEGLAYILSKKMEYELASEMRKEAERCFNDFYLRIAKTADAVHVDPVKTVEEPMLMNLSILTTDGKTNRLRRTLKEIEKTGEFKVRLTGPWPPYSFV